MKTVFHIPLFVLLLISSVSNITVCQIKTSATFSNPWLTKAKKVKTDSKEYKKFVRDSLRDFRKLGKLYRHKYDSISRAITRSAEQRIGISQSDWVLIKNLKKTQKKYTSQEDSVSVLNDSKQAANEALKKAFHHKKDSVTGLLNRLSQKYGGISIDQMLDPKTTIKGKSAYYKDQVPYYGEAIPLYQVAREGFNKSQIDSMLMSQLGHKELRDIPTDSLKYFMQARDSLMLVQLQNNLESYGATMVGVDQMKLDEQQLLAEQERLEAYQANFNRYRDKKNVKDQLSKLSKGELNTTSKTLNSGHEALSKYKKKYVTLPSTNDIKSGRKIVSLKGRTFWERSRAGGSIKISQREYLEIDMAPSFAYLLHKKWSIGTELVFRAEFGNGRKWQNSFKTNTRGVRLFSDYTVYKSFFAHGEFENMYVNSTSMGSDSKQRQTIPGLLIGLGKTFGVGKNVNGKVLVQYNFLHKDNNLLYASPWVIRFGFETKKLKKKK